MYIFFKGSSVEHKEQDAVFLCEWATSASAFLKFPACVTVNILISPNDYYSC